MTWLVAHMWIALAGAAGIALLFGWSIRGMLLLGKLRRAEVERDVTRVELGEARDEIERLFAAQRKLLAGQGGAAAVEAAQMSPQADPELERRLVETASALEEARAELEALKAAPPILAPAPELAAVPAIDGAAMLRTRGLEDRISGLEGELEEARRALAAAEVARAEAVAAAVPLAAPEPAPEADPKLVWKVGYLAQRVKALEEEVAVQPAAALQLQPEDAPPAEVAVVAPLQTAIAAEDTEQASAEEELARLRWRNRYLEGRVAYFEGDAESVAEEIAAGEEEDEADQEPGAAEETESRGEGGGETSEEDEDAEAIETSGEDDDGDAAAGLDEASGEEDFEEFEEEADASADFEAEEDDHSVVETILGQLEEEDARADAEDDEDVEAEVEVDDDQEPVEEEIAPARPLALERPVEGAPDDLTLIGGIGPRIQEVLNSLGIYHYDQIAEWTPQNIAWVDEYLNFSGRIRREGWVEQAAILVGESVDS